MRVIRLLRRPGGNHAVLPAVVMLVAACGSGGTDAAPPPHGVSLAPMLEKVLPAIVNISSTRSTVQLRHGQLWVLIQDLTPELAAAFGLQHTGGAVITGAPVAESAARRYGTVYRDPVVRAVMRDGA